MRSERLRRVHHTTGDLFNSIFDTYIAVHEHLPGGFKTLPPEELWHKIPALHGYQTNPITYSVDDTATISGAKFDDIMGELRLLASRRNSVIACIAPYNDLRCEIGRALVPFQKARSGDQIATDLRYRENAELRLLELQVSGMAAQISEALTNMKDEVIALVPRYNGLLKDLNGPKTKTRIELTGTAFSSDGAQKGADAAPKSS